MATIQSPVLQNTKRAAEPMFPVWDLAGVKHLMTQPNINDKVRHCGWYQKDPSYLVAQAQAMQARAAGILAAADQARQAPATPTPEAAAQPVDDGSLPRLTGLRKELSDAGGIPDPTWGVARLQQAIDAKKAGVPLPADPEDE